jgi:hypothetical protein
MVEKLNINMRAKEFITELFDSHIPYKWIHSTRADFTITDYRFIVWFAGNKDEISVGFDFEDKNGEIHHDVTNAFKNSGVAFMVFGTVAKILSEFLKREAPNTFVFSADTSEPSRIKLYDRLAEKIGKTLPYEFENKYKQNGSQYYRFFKV